MTKDTRFDGLAKRISALETNSTMDGGAFDVTQVTENAIQLMAGPASAPPPVVENFILRGGKQILDGITWKHVTFIKTNISYKGGSLSLDDVRFVNCTFTLIPDRQSTRFAQYVALAQTELRVGDKHPS